MFYVSTYSSCSCEYHLCIFVCMCEWYKKAEKGLDDIKVSAHKDLITLEKWKTDRSGDTERLSCQLIAR